MGLSQKQYLFEDIMHILHSPGFRALSVDQCGPEVVSLVYLPCGRSRAKQARVQDAASLFVCVSRAPIHDIPFYQLILKDIYFHFISRKRIEVFYPISYQIEAFQ